MVRGVYSTHTLVQTLFQGQPPNHRLPNTVTLCAMWQQYPINDSNVYHLAVWVDREHRHKNKKHNNPPLLDVARYSNSHTHKTIGRNQWAWFQSLHGCIQGK